MADSKKYNGSTWEHSLRKLTTATEAVENPLYSDGTAITSYTIKGNMEQTGTPTSASPIYPSETGERTENIAEDVINNTSKAQYVIVLKIKAELQSDTTYTLSFNAPAGLKVYTNEYLFVRVNYETTEGLNTIALTTLTIDKTDTRQYQDGYFNVLKNTNTQSISVTLTDIMVNSGSTAKPYEPYGYKIPISNGQQTTNIYLGSTQTVRQVKKLVFTGDEASLNLYNGFFYLYSITPDYLRAQDKITYMCSHYVAYAQTTDGTSIPNGGMAMSYNTNNQRIYFQDTQYSTLEQYREYLRTEYANGTPVTVWYVLAVPETAAVNEPLMKIGDYADTLSNAASIPTTEGANSITVDTTVQPSEFTATWTGWHDASVKEWDGSDWT